MVTSNFSLFLLTTESSWFSYLSFSHLLSNFQDSGAIVSFPILYNSVYLILFYLTLILAWPWKGAQMYYQFSLYFYSETSVFNPRMLFHFLINEISSSSC